MMYRLIQRGVPEWFPYNSLHVMQPMYTKKMNQQIATELGTIKQYTTADPKPPRHKVVLTTQAAALEVLEDNKRFVVPWLQAINDMFPGEKDCSWYMLAGDKPENAADKKLLQKAFASTPNFPQIMADFIATNGRALLEQELFKMKDGLYQVDLLRDIAIPLNARLLADIFYFDLKTPENPKGSLCEADLYKHLSNIRTWGANNNDPALAWNRRRWAREGADIMIKSTKELVNDAVHGPPRSLLSFFASSLMARKGSVKNGSLRSCGLKIVETLLEGYGGSIDKTVDALWLNAFGAIAVPVTAYCEIMQFFLAPENTSIWSKVQDLAARGDDKTIRAYVIEAMRLTTSQRDVRIATTSAVVQGQKINPGDAVIIMFVSNSFWHF